MGQCETGNHPWPSDGKTKWVHLKGGGERKVTVSNGETGAPIDMSPKRWLGDSPTIQEDGGMQQLAGLSN